MYFYSNVSNINAFAWHIRHVRGTYVPWRKLINRDNVVADYKYIIANVFKFF